MDVRRFERIEYESFFAREQIENAPLYPVDFSNRKELQFDRRDFKPDPERPASPFAPDDYVTYFESLQKLADSTIIRLREQTTLPGFLHPDLSVDGALQVVPAGTSLEEAARSFLTWEEFRTAQIALTGLPDGDIALRFSQWSGWSRELLHSRLIQVVGQEEIPIYGGRITLTYDGNFLLFVTNALYPVANSLLTYTLLEPGAWREAPQDWYETLEIGNLPPFITPNRFLPPPLVWSPGGAYKLDRCVFPYDPRYRRQSLPDKVADLGEVEWYLEGKDAQWTDKFLVYNRSGGLYRPAWRVILEDTEGNHWLTIIDAESQQVLWLYSTHAYAAHQVFLTSKDALNGTSTQLPLPQYTGVGQGESRVHFLTTDPLEGNSRFVNPDLGATTADARLTANVYHHIDEMQPWYRDLLKGYGFDLTSPTQPHGYEKIDIFLNPSASNGTFYRWSDHRINIGADAAGPTAAAIFEPGLDPEVLYHEYTHAIVHLLLDNKGIAYAPGSYDKVLQEAWAYYFGCSRTVNSGLIFQINSPEALDKATWADSAYRNQPINLAAPILPYATVLNLNPHRKGEWWGRFFWLFIRENSLPLDIANKLLLQLVQAEVYAGFEATARNTFAMTLLILLAKIDANLAATKKPVLHQLGFSL